MYIHLQNHTLPGLAASRRGFAVFIVSLLLFASRALSDPMFASSAVPLVDGPVAEAPVIATLAVAAKVERLETRDGFHRVALEGWAREGAKRVLFSLPGKRILAATIPRAKVNALEQRGSTNDPDTGITWRLMRTEGWISQSALQPNLDPIWNTAWDLFAERCTACHQRRVPENYTANQWRSLIKVMGPRAGLPKSDQMLILAYLQNHASDTIETEADGE